MAGTRECADRARERLARLRDRAGAEPTLTGDDLDRLRDVLGSVTQRGAPELTLIEWSGEVDAEPVRLWVQRECLSGADDDGTAEVGDEICDVSLGNLGAGCYE